MPIKTFYLEGTASASTSWTRIDSEEVPSTETWRLKEMRVHASADGVYFRIFHEKQLIIDSKTDIHRAWQLPVPLDEEVRGGEEIVLEANNPTGSDVSLYIEFIYEM